MQRALPLHRASLLEKTACKTASGHPPWKKSGKVFRPPMRRWWPPCRQSTVQHFLSWAIFCTYDFLFQTAHLQVIAFMSLFLARSCLSYPAENALCRCCVKTVLEVIAPPLKMRNLLVQQISNKPSIRRHTISRPGYQRLCNKILTVFDTICNNFLRYYHVVCNKILAYQGMIYIKVNFDFFFKVICSLYDMLPI